MSSKLEELKKEATQLGINYSPNIGEAKLQEKIDAHYESQETSSTELIDLVDKLKADEPKVEVPVVAAKDQTSFRAFAKKLEAEARKTRVVTIIDNDQRENNYTTSCIATCENEFFDLGTVVLPLNEKVEVRQGHINSLKEVMIPQHVRDPDNPSLSRMVIRPRYTVSYEDMQ